MKTTYFLCISILIIASNFVKGQASHQDSERPNILLIYTDDQSHRTVSAYQDEGAWPWVHTPNIDRLAAEGVRFTYAYGASWCMPSKASVLTGQYQHAIGGMNFHERAPADKKWACYGDCYDRDKVNFWPVNFREHGYETAMIGKWHLGQDAGHGWLWDHSVVWDQNTPEGDWYNNQKLSIDGKAAVAIPGYSTDVYTQYAEDFIDKNHEKPWLLWLCYNAPHLPNTFHPRDSALYENADVKLPPGIFGPRPDKPTYMHELTMFSRNENGDTIYRNEPLSKAIIEYNRLVNAVDDGLGNILSKLEETDQLENTLIIFTSDQGFAWGEQGFAWKVAPYDATIRMPLIFRMPKRIAKNKVCRQPATIVDIAPTILTFAGVDVPWEMQGRDLSQLLISPEKNQNWPVLMEHFYNRFGAETNVGETGSDFAGEVPYWLMLRQSQYKYIRTLVPHEIEELYDLENDPNELDNLAIDQKYHSKVQEFRQKLISELERTDAGFIRSMPSIVERSR